MKNLTLAIETSVKSGSLSILSEEREVAGWTGSRDISRSEDLLPQIKKLLGENNFRLDEVKIIAVSTGPGSFTGIRIGLTIAAALSQALDSRLIGCPTFEAVRSFYSNAENCIVVIPAGRNRFYRQFFNNAGQSEIEMISAEALARDLTENDSSAFVIESEAFESLDGHLKNKANIEVIEGSLARLIGVRAMAKSRLSNEKRFDLSPVYFREALAR